MTILPPSLLSCQYIQLLLGPSDYKLLSQKLKDTFGANRLMFGLEGGYEPERVAQGIEETLRPFL